VGIEVVSAGYRWPLTDILAAYGLDPADEAQLRAYFLPAGELQPGHPVKEALAVISAEPTAPRDVLAAA
jgi:hypothetical protein